MAHLLEHMLFKGTPKHADIAQGVQCARRALQRHHLADRTNYYELFQASDDNLDWALEMEADRMVNSLHREEGPRHAR